MKAYFIDTLGGTGVTAVEYNDADDIRRMLKGDLELAHQYDNGDVVYVDDEGMFKYHKFFIVPGAHQPFAGNGVVVGREFPGTARTRPPRSTLRELQIAIRFPSPLQVTAKTSGSLN